MDKLRELTDIANRSDQWMAIIKPIYKADLKAGKNGVEKITADQFFGRAPVKDEPKPGEEVIHFGKYKNKPISWVKTNDKSYWHWLQENVKGFDKK
jgi:hypothetical protein